MDAQAATLTSFLSDVPPWAIGIGGALCLCLVGAGLVLLRPKIRHSRTINTFAELKRQADEFDDAKACREVFLMLHDGRGVTRDAKEADHYRLRAIRRYKALARGKDPHACMRVAELIDHGRIGAPSDDADAYYHQALTLYEPPARRGDPHALLVLGHLYRYGLGCKQNFDTAIGFWEQAAAAKSVAAMKRLAELYGAGGPKADGVKALKWWRAVALTGDAEAQEKVGDSYRDNLGEPTHREEAYRWYAYAARRGRHGVKAKLEDLEKGWTSAQIMDVQNRLKTWTPA